MNLKYMKVSLFEISYKKKLFHHIHIFWDAHVLYCLFVFNAMPASVAIFMAR